MDAPVTAADQGVATDRLPGGSDRTRFQRAAPGGYEPCITRH